METILGAKIKSFEGFIFNDIELLNKSAA